MYASSYVFSKGFFKGWIVVVFLWAFFATFTITLLPIWESRHSLVMFARYVVSGKISKSGPATKTVHLVDAATLESDSRSGSGVVVNEKGDEKVGNSASKVPMSS